MSALAAVLSMRDEGYTLCPHTHTCKNTKQVRTQQRLRGSPQSSMTNYEASDPHQQWCADDDRGVAHAPLPFMFH